MTKDQLKELSIRRDEKVRELLKAGSPDTSLEVRKLIRDYKAMDNTLYLMTDSLLKFAYEKLLSEFDKLNDEFEEAEELEQKLSKIDILNELHTYWHDQLVVLAGTLKGEIAHVFGVNSLSDALEVAGKRQGDDLTGALAKLEDVEKRMAILARIMNSHMGHEIFEEDDEKYIMVHDPCGSGGRLWRNKLYEPDGRIKLVSQPHPVTLGRSNFPSYCTHCPSWNVILALQVSGVPSCVVYPPEYPEDKCIWHIYKDPNKIPQEYLDLVK